MNNKFKFLAVGISAFIIGLSLNNIAVSDVPSKIAVVDVSSVVNSSSQVQALKKEQQAKAKELMTFIEKARKDVAATTDTKKDDVKQVEKKDAVDKTNTEENKETSVKPAENAAKAELKGQVKDIVEESGVDTSKLTNDQINELNKINFSKEAKSGTQLTYNDFKKLLKL